VFEKNIFSRFFLNNAYLLIIAAWLFTFSFLINHYWFPYSDISAAQREITRYVNGAETEFYNLTKDTVLPILGGNGQIPAQTREKIVTRKFYLFVYRNNTGIPAQLAYWSTQNVLPDSSIIRSPNRAGFVQLPNGFYVWNKFDSAGILSIALIPVKWNYIITNNYLKNTFVFNPEIGNHVDISPGNEAEGSVRSIHGASLFRLIKKTTHEVAKDNVISVWLSFAASLFILVFIHLCALHYAKKRKLRHVLGVLVPLLLLVRVASYFYPIPFNLRQLDLFDPAIYGYNPILRSLGDLLINVLLLLWICGFVRYQLLVEGIPVKKFRPFHKWAWLLGATCIILSSTFVAERVIGSLIADSQISFDVIHFFSLNIYSVLGFFIICCIAVVFYFLCQIVVLMLKPSFPEMFLELYLLSAVIGLMFLSFDVWGNDRVQELFILAWLILYLFLLNSSHLNQTSIRNSNPKLIFWMFFFSLSITLLIVKENTEKELRKRHHYAEVLATKSDPMNEAMLNSMLSDLRPDFLQVHFSRFRTLKSNQSLKDSIINNIFTGFTNHFNTRIFTFDDKDIPLFNEEKASFNQLNTILYTQSKPTSVKGFFYYNESYERYNFISKKEIVDTSGKLLGTIFILVSPKVINDQMLYPELFSKGSSADIENSSIYAYAIYYKKKLISSHNDYPFSTTMQPEKLFTGQYRMRYKNNRDELWFHASSDKFIVIAKENSIVVESITLFSYLFCAFLLLAALFWAMKVIVESRLIPSKIRGIWQLSIRNQIHGIIIFVSTLSFVVIGVVTILFFKSRYETNDKDKLGNTIQIMKTQLAASLSGGWRLTDSMLVIDGKTKPQEGKMITDMAAIHGVDINIYDLYGNLRFASLPLPYVKGILSPKMEPTAYYHLNVLQEIQYFQKEHIGTLNYISSYVPVSDEAGNQLAYLNIPYFTSERMLQQEIANFLVTIINLNAFIFLMAGIVALFITNKITDSFSLISEKMKKMDLGKKNEPIQWRRNDEIGMLVSQYNKMLSKLEESAVALAATERESAWREMARQVAHEIKNPLTPMKLSMQFLQRSIEKNAPNVKELSAKMAITMIEQINYLNNIATEFSEFANIESAVGEKVDLDEFLQSVKQLYEGNEGIFVRWGLMCSPVIVEADKTHLNRLFTNLMQNAIQSVREGVRPVITIDESIVQGRVLLTIKDNGEGIPENVQSHIFRPNFTTKTSGTGLGLAMCKRIVDQMNGKIWFETFPHEGTSFFVSFPLSED
jgi:two-component system nitrogen regulation sensor histidine kinase NtrY